MTGDKVRRRRYLPHILILVFLAIVVTVLAKRGYWNPPPKPFDSLLAKWGLWTPPPTFAEIRKQQEEDREKLAEALNLAGVKTTLNPLYNAWVVSFDGGQVSDDHLRDLIKLLRVYKLDLKDSSITDEQLGILNQISSIVYLDLSGTDVTDAGLDRLDALPYLATFTLTGSKVTTEGIDRFQARRKNNAELEQQREAFSKQYRQLPPLPIVTNDPEPSEPNTGGEGSPASEHNE